VDRTQTQQAETLGLNRSQYGELERSDDPAPKDTFTKTLPLAPHERCLLYRRRLGYTQKDVAQAVGVSRWWCNLMERGAVSPGLLVKFWEGSKSAI
jgi:DNA-binding XRE family transcriptional regulator